MATLGESESRIELERLIENKIGNGSFGVVYKGLFAGSDVAVKVINRHMNTQYWDKLKNETIVLDKKLAHPNVIEILKYEDKYPQKPEVWIAMERCQESLESYLENNSLDDAHILDVHWQCANGLSYLHKNHVVHRDLKVDNILIKLENSSYIMKVTDFSLSKDIAGMEEEGQSTTIHGNKHWLAPEMFNDEDRKAERVRFTRWSLQKMDVFCFALIILYTCLTKEGRQAMCKKYELGLEVKRGKDVLDYFRHQWSSDRLKQIVTPFLQKMLSLNAEDRPSMEEVCQFFTSHVSPPTVSTAPCLVLQTSHLLGYEADLYVGIGGRHLILLGCEKPDTLRLLQWKDDGYKELWEKACPRGVSYSDRKFVADDESLITRDWENDPTRCWSGDLTLLHTPHTVGGDRMLRAVLPLHTFIYMEEIDGGCQLVLQDRDQQDLILRPPNDTKWTNGLSVCRHPTSGWMAATQTATDLEKCTLTVFNQSGEVQYHGRLNYTPGLRSAITSTASHLIVREAGTTVLHFHAWNGNEVGRVDLRQVVAGLGEEFIRSVGVCESDMLHVAVGGRSGQIPYVSSLHALKVKTIDKM